MLFRSLYVLLLVPLLALTVCFVLGIALLLSVASVYFRDLRHLWGIFTQVWMYGSGVMFSIHHMTGPDSNVPSWVGTLLQANPAAVYIDLMRFALIDSFDGSMLPDHVWALALGWALVAGIGGFIYFWKAEETYGRG